MSDDLKGGEYYSELYYKLRNDPKFIFKYGMEQGEILMRERIIKLLKLHAMTDKSVSGFLAVCTCGEAIDDYQKHLLDAIKGENK